MPAPGPLDELLCHLQCFFFQRPRKERWINFDPVPAYKRLQRHIGQRILTELLAISFDRIYFFNMAHQHFDFTFKQKAFGEPIQTLKWRLSNDCQITCSALVSGPLNRKHNKQIISLVFSIPDANYGSLFFSIDLWPARFALGP